MAYDSENRHPSFLLFLVIGIGCLIWCITESVSAMRYATGSAWAEGRVASCYARGMQARSGDSQNVCDYEFALGTTTFSGSIAGSNLQEGQKVNVAYLKSDPSNNTLEPPQWFPIGLVALVASIISFGISAKLFMSNDDIIED